MIYGKKLLKEHIQSNSWLDKINLLVFHYQLQSNL